MDRAELPVNLGNFRLTRKVMANRIMREIYAEEQALGFPDGVPPLRCSEAPRPAEVPRPLEPDLQRYVETVIDEAD